MADLKVLLGTIEIRLRETLQVFAAYKTLNRVAKQNEQLQTMLNSSFTFWHACAVAFAAHVIQGLTALTESDGQSATLARLMTVLSASHSQDVIPDEVREIVSSVHQRYKRYRDKLVSHTDKRRAEIADEFDAEGFTWDSVQDDLAKIVTAFELLRGICVEGKAGLPAGRPRSISLVEFLAAQTEEDTERVLMALLPSLPSFSEPVGMVRTLFNRPDDDFTEQ